MDNITITLKLSDDGAEIQNFDLLGHGQVPVDQLVLHGQHNLEQLLIALYYKQVSANITMYNRKIKTLFISPEMPETGFNTLHDFLVWLRTGSNPEDINQF